VNNAEVFNEIQAMKIPTSKLNLVARPSIEVYSPPAKRKHNQIEKTLTFENLRAIVEKKKQEDEIKNKSATAIQAVARGMKAKKEAKNLKEEKEKENASAKTLQATLRRKLQAKELKTKKNSDAFDARTLNKGRPKKVKGAKYNETSF
jgi:hypothetical protein